MADDMNLQIVLEAVDESQAGFSAMDHALQAVQKLADELSKSFASFASGIDQAMNQASTATEEVIKPIEDVIKSADQMAKPFEDAAKSAEDASKAVEQIAKPLGEVSQAADEASKVLDQTSKAAEDVAKSTEDIATNAAKAGEQAADGMKPMNDEIEKIRQTILLTEDELRNLVDTSSIKTLEGEAANAGQLPTSELKKLYEQQSGNKAIISGEEEKKGVSDMGTQNDLMYGGMAMGAAALPIIAGFKDAIQTFMDFDQAVANVNTMLGDTPDQLGAVKQQLIELSKTVPDGPTALANALYGIVGAGVPAADAMNVLKTASQAAAAGQTDVSTATSALISVMDSYGMSAKDVGKISDQMFAANAAGAMTFTDFAKSIGTVAGPAAQAGVSFDQVAAATAALTNQGISAQRATEGLRALMMGIMAPTAGATKEAQKLGIEWDANTLKSKGLTGMMQEAMKATGGNSEELKKLIPNIAAWTVATDLGGKGADSYRQAMDTMGHSAGATGRAMQAQSEGMSEKVDHLKASVEAAQITFTNLFAPALESIVEKITSLVQSFQNMNPHTQKFILAIAGGAAVLLSLAGGAMMFMSVVGNVINGFMALRDAFMAVSVAEGIMDALDPMMWIVLAVVALVAAAAAIYAYWDDIKAFFVRTWNEIKQKAADIWGSITAFFKKWGMDILYALPFVGLVAYVVTHWTQIKTETEAIWNGIKQWLVNLWTSVVTGAENIWNGLVSGIGNIFNNIVNGVRNIWNGFVSWIKSAVTNFGQMLLNGFSWMYNHNYYFKDMVDSIVSHWNTLREKTLAIWNAITGALSTAWNWIKSTGQTIISWYVNYWRTSWQQAHDDVVAIWTAISTFFTKIWNTIKSLAEAGAKWVVSKLDDQWTEMQKRWHDVWDPISQYFGTVWTNVKTATQTAWDSIVQYLTAKWNAITDGVNTIKTSIENKFNELVGEAESWGENLIHMFANGIKNTIHEIEDSVKAAGQKVADFLGFHSPTKDGPASDSDQWAPNFIKMFAGGISGGASQIAKAANSMISPLSASIGGTMNHAIAAGPIAYGTVGGAAPVINITVNASGNVTRNERELAKIVSAELYKQAKAIGKF